MVRALIFAGFRLGFVLFGAFGGIDKLCRSGWEPLSEKAEPMRLLFGTIKFGGVRELEVAVAAAGPCPGGFADAGPAPTVAPAPKAAPKKLNSSTPDMLPSRDPGLKPKLACPAAIRRFA